MSDNVNLAIGQVLIVPRGAPGLEPLKFDLSEVNHAEKRKSEVVYVNKETAPSLLHTFNHAYCEVLRMITQIAYELHQAMKFADKRKGIVMLDIAPEVLMKKGLTSKKSPTGSEDLRKAVLDQDEEYLALIDKAAALKTFQAFLKIKARGFEMAYQTVKKVYDPMNTALGNMNDLRGDIDEGLGAGDIEIGEPRFGYRG